MITKIAMMIVMVAMMRLLIVVLVMMMPVMVMVVLMMLSVMVPEGLDDGDDCKWLVVVLFIVIS